jgi:putative ATPase
MKNLNYGKEYHYAHSYAGNFVKDNFLPEKLAGKLFYDPGANTREKDIRDKLGKMWDGIYPYNRNE